MSKEFLWISVLQTLYLNHKVLFKDYFNAYRISHLLGYDLLKWLASSDVMEEQALNSDAMYQDLDPHTHATL